MSDLFTLLTQQFPAATFSHGDYQLGLGAFPEWDSLGHFNLLLLIEQHYAVRFEPNELAELKRLVDIKQALQIKGVAV